MHVHLISKYVQTHTEVKTNSHLDKMTNRKFHIHVSQTRLLQEHTHVQANTHLNIHLHKHLHINKHTNAPNHTPTVRHTCIHTHSATHTHAFKEENLGGQSRSSSGNTHECKQFQAATKTDRGSEITFPLPPC